jgi:DNA-binding GntR family transcriptional regulator
MRRSATPLRGTSGVTKGSLDESSPTTLTAQVLGRMRSDILELRLEPDSKLVLEELRDKSDKTKTPRRKRT